jgi:hypothetical protein
MTAIIAYPLTYIGAQKYSKQKPFTASKCLAIAWLFYFIGILIGLLLVRVYRAVIAFGPLLHLPMSKYVIYEVLELIVGWMFMFIYQEQARKSSLTCP